MKNPRSILITGASSGIGTALALAYAGPSVTLALSGRNKKRLDSVVSACRERGAKVISRAMDIQNADEVRAWVHAVDDESPLDLVIANAGINSGGGMDGRHESEVSVRKVFRVNLEGVVNAVLPVMGRLRERRRGQIAIISSLMALRGIPQSPAYCASKAAVGVLGESWRALLAPDGIHVSVIYPGFVKTRMSDRLTGPKPFMISAEKAAGIIRSGLGKKKAKIIFPKIQWLGVRFLTSLPLAWGDSFLRRITMNVPDAD